MKTFNTEEAADFLKTSTDTLMKLAGEGIVPGAKIGRSWVFTDEGLESYLRGEILQQTTARANPGADPIKTAFSREISADKTKKQSRRKRGFIPSLSLNP